MKLPQGFIADMEPEFDLRSYSGRFMYGRDCLGLTGEVKDLIMFAIRVQEWYAAFDDDGPPDAYEHWLTGVRQDQMGLDMIFYWPDVEYDDSLSAASPDAEED